MENTIIQNNKYKNHPICSFLFHSILSALLCSCPINNCASALLSRNVYFGGEEDDIDFVILMLIYYDNRYVIL